MITDSFVRSNRLAAAVTYIAFLSLFPLLALGAAIAAATLSTRQIANLKQKIAEQICMELKIHTMIEEEIFYPACRGQIEDDLVDEAYVEHDGAKLLINEIEAGGPDDDFYEAKVKVLQEQIEQIA